MSQFEKLPLKIFVEILLSPQGYDMCEYDMQLFLDHEGRHDSSRLKKIWDYTAKRLSEYYDSCQITPRRNLTIHDLNPSDPGGPTTEIETIYRLNEYKLHDWYSGQLDEIESRLESEDQTEYYSAISELQFLLKVVGSEYILEFQNEITSAFGNDIPKDMPLWFNTTLNETQIKYMLKQLKEANIVDQETTFHQFAARYRPIGYTDIKQEDLITLKWRKAIELADFTKQLYLHKIINVTNYWAVTASFTNYKAGNLAKSISNRSPVTSDIIAKIIINSETT